MLRWESKFGSIIEIRNWEKLNDPWNWKIKWDGDWRVAYIRERTNIGRARC